MEVGLTISQRFGTGLFEVFGSRTTWDVTKENGSNFKSLVTWAELEWEVPKHRLLTLQDRDCDSKDAALSSLINRFIESGLGLHVRV